MARERGRGCGGGVERRRCESDGLEAHRWARIVEASPNFDAE